MLVSRKCRTYGCWRRGFWQKPVVHNHTIIEFDERNQCIVRTKTFGWLNEYLFVLEHGRTHGFDPTCLVLKHLVD